MTNKTSYNKSKIQTDESNGLEGYEIMTIQELQVDTYLSCAREALKHKEPFSANLFYLLATYAYALACEEKGVSPQ